MRPVLSGVKSKRFNDFVNWFIYYISYVEALCANKLLLIDLLDDNRNIQQDTQVPYQNTYT